MVIKQSNKIKVEQPWKFKKKSGFGWSAMSFAKKLFFFHSTCPAWSWNNLKLSNNAFFSIVNPRDNYGNSFYWHFVMEYNEIRQKLNQFTNKKPYCVLGVGCRGSSPDSNTFWIFKFFIFLWLYVEKMFMLIFIFQIIMLRFSQFYTIFSFLLSRLFEFIFYFVLCKYNQSMSLKKNKRNRKRDSRRNAEKKTQKWKTRKIKRRTDKRRKKTRMKLILWMKKNNNK